MLPWLLTVATPPANMPPRPPEICAPLALLTEPPATSEMPSWAAPDMLPWLVTVVTPPVAAIPFCEPEMRAATPLLITVPAVTRSTE